jgi:hypothetical protein
LRVAQWIPHHAPMKNKTAFAGTSLLCVVALAQACGGEESQDQQGAALDPQPAPAAAQTPTVTIIAPTEGETVAGPDVLVRLGASGVTIVPAANHDPGTGHHHIFIDRDPTPMQDTIPAGVPDIRHLGQGQTEFLLEGLAPGEHRLITVIADWSHVPLDPPAVDTVRFTVSAPPTP